MSGPIAVQAMPATELQATCTTCPYCGVGCGVRVITQQGTASSGGQPAPVVRSLAGDPQHPANRGKLCVKGSALGETLGLSTRLLTPMQGRGGARRPVDWDTALETVAQGFAETIRVHGPDSVAFYVSGQLLTEDYYVVNKFVKGYLGTANIDTNSRLCMSSAVAAHQRAFGEDVVPGCYEDVERADLVVLVGSNTAWCHPVLYQRLQQARAARPADRPLRVVVIDPRHTLTCEEADLHLPVLPGMDVLLFNGLLQYLHQQGQGDAAFLQAHTLGLEATLAASAEGAELAAVARRCGLEPGRLTQFFEWFAQTRRVVTLFSMGVNQSRQGTDKANAIINCHLYTGRIGQPGMGPFSLTGQPNAMGGREVGGLATQLAAHLKLDQPAHRALVQGFWNSPVMASQPGLKAVELFEAVEQGRIKALWVMATNPVVSLPNADQVRRALQQCPLVVVSEVVADTDTTAFADVLLPALGWGEKDGTVTNTERRISRQRAFLPAPGQARPDWWAVSQVAQRLGHGQGFGYQQPAEVFEEHARLSAQDNPEQVHGEGVFRRFNLRGLCGLSRTEYDALPPVQWPVLQRPDGRPQPSQRLCAAGGFSHADGKARLIPVQSMPPVHAVSPEYPLLLNTGRVRDQWHTMTRTGLAPTLGQHSPEPFCQIHPQDALGCGVREGELVRVRSAWGSVVVRAQCSTRIRRGQVFVPIHWNEQFASDARVGALVNPVVDPLSGEPEFKHTPVCVTPFAVNWQGLLFSRASLPLETVSWWSRVQLAGLQRYELAGRDSLAGVQAQARALLGFDEATDEWMAYHDQGSGLFHALLLREAQVQAALYVAPPSQLPDRDWVASRFARQRLSAVDRMALLAGVALGGGSAEGPLVCSCFKVGKNRLLKAIREQGLTTPQQVTACLKAGGNCGSCVPEIRGLIASCQAEDPCA